MNINIVPTINETLKDLFNIVGSEATIKHCFIFTLNSYVYGWVCYLDYQLEGCVTKLNIHIKCKIVIY